MEERLLRVSQILGNPKKGIEPIFPVSRSTWWQGVKDGRFPAPVKIGGATFWKWSSIKAFLDQQGQ